MINEQLKQYELIFKKTDTFIEHITCAIYPNIAQIDETIPNLKKTSAVLFLLGMSPSSHPDPLTPSVILTKRSQQVKQPGDLCCPGGSLTYPIDRIIASLLLGLEFPFRRWKYRRQWKKDYKKQVRSTAIYLAAGIREGFEEISLNPFDIQFLGVLPYQQLVMFQQKIYPFVAWVSHQKKFLLSREVEKVVWIPIRYLLNPKNYARYCIEMPSNGFPKRIVEYPCVLYKTSHEEERLWGATYRIAMAFLQLVFDFSPPTLETLPQIFGTLDMTYLTGKKISS